MIDEGGVGECKRGNKNVIVQNLENWASEDKSVFITSFFFPFNGLHKLVIHTKGYLHLLFGFVVSLVKRATASSFGLGSYRGKVDFVVVLKLFLIKIVRCYN